MTVARRKPAQLISTIHVAPLTSILLILFACVLSIVFYLTPYIGGSVDLPYSHSAKLLWHAQRVDAIHIAIQRNGAIFIGNDKVGIEQIPLKIRESVAHGSERRVYLHVDAFTSYKNVEKVIDAINQANIQNVSFLANPKNSQSSFIPRPSNK